MDGGEEEHLQAAVAVGEAGDHPRLALSGGLPGDTGDQTGRPHAAFGASRGEQVGDGGAAVAAEDVLGTVQGMGGGVEVEHLPFGGEQQPAGPLLVADPEVEAEGGLPPPGSPRPVKRSSWPRAAAFFAGMTASTAHARP